MKARDEIFTVMAHKLWDIGKIKFIKSDNF